MFFVRATGVDARITTVCTAEAASAVGHHVRLVRCGLNPTVTDWKGRSITLAELKRQADADKALSARH